MKFLICRGDIQIWRTEEASRTISSWHYEVPTKNMWSCPSFSLQIQSLLSPTIKFCLKIIHQAPWTNANFLRDMLTKSWPSVKHTDMEELPIWQINELCCCLFHFGGDYLWCTRARCLHKLPFFVSFCEEREGVIGDFVACHYKANLFVI